ncbi:MAG: hypothetical protein AUH43_09360 [Acidobacteria bacterium 13_1_40CM_65_14]|nr:MAG: hypothetical protein AUH43_09360 [Acidobacteria bacterium 13_1_40CM_65_14]OLC83761.1 MAG: hypothetical protein AUH72_03565 [Acidobacteria bacterium 13_1_40CM_4_65_8]OLE78740.1 MAG: hypothetical protein AUF76_18580 [Acidobacteria bacterium 13_1_20CM_2_65_9]
MDMQRLGIYLVSLALTLGGYAARAAGDTKAADLLAQARAALGGESKLSKVQGLSASGTYQREMGDRQITGEITIDFQLPDKMVRTDSMNPMGDATIVVLQGVNGDQVLRHSRTIGGGPGMVVRMAPPAAGSDGEAQALRNQRADMARFALAFLLTSPSAMPVEFTYGGEAEAPDNDVAKADVVDAKGQGSFAARIFLDKKSHRPLMLQYRGAAPRIVMQTQRGGPPPAGNAPQGRGDHEAPAGSGSSRTPPDAAAAPQIVDIQMFLDDYKSVDGVMLPHHISRSIDGKPNEEWTFKTIKVNPAFKPDTFSGK